MKKDNFPGTWDSSAAGHLNVGEDYDASAMRETREELGFDLPSVPEKVLRIEACEETGQEFVWVYRCRYEGPFQLHPDEIEMGGWFTRDYLSLWIDDRPGEFAPSFICIWRQLYGANTSR